MAEPNKPGVEFRSEILSPSELFTARSRSHKIPVRGQKDFFPNDSEQQRQRLQQSLDEHWDLVSEERVERLGNLVKALWIPSDQTVELQSPAGKFWQTMGFSADGKQYLRPEEALYLMECGNLQVFYRDLPLSIQEGYERFLSSKTVTLKQYQVFGHLKRLGYVVNRFDPSSVPSSYERQLNLPVTHDRTGKQLKRKRSPSPTPLSRYTEGEEASSSSQMEEKHSNTDEKDNKTPDCAEDQTTSEPSQAQTTPHTEDTSSADGGRGRSWWREDRHPEPGRGLNQPQQHGSRWDFGLIAFPDLGSRESVTTRLASPEPSLLPGALTVGVCEVTPWMKRLNLREVKMSASELRREQRRIRHRRDINKDKEVRRCQNWVEYHELQETRRRRCGKRPAHLWEENVTPLHNPRQCISTGELLNKISVVKSSRLLDGASSLKGSEEWKICFNVYQPDTVAEFKKSNPGKPYSRMCVCSFDGPVPDLRAVKLLAFQSGDIPVSYAVVDHGDISFYTFKDFQLPTDVFQ
ncbi:tRNA-splicing endonuclease subunit Sen54 isoform X2 [Lampris incognitus]|uniref:tRNA-splicing endonuclease subunit Sen54 isoform X2 n=1 Tax=Lampris incognitus TaxID=2546036 RepID=UPI0024B49D4E|nr:tRNA-splicing endonuclease subunit Sen54 isoform X2 [Lampris incognitus]